MSNDENMTEEFRAALHDAVETAASREVDWAAFHAALNAGPVASRLRELRRYAAEGYRVTVSSGAAWWDYAARGALACVPIGLAAALLFFAYLRSGSDRVPDDSPAIATVAASARSTGSARAAFESVLTGDAAPGAAMAALIPVPADVIPADSAGEIQR
jgi:hypothetical protein